MEYSNQINLIFFAISCLLTTLALYFKKNKILFIIIIQGLFLDIFSLQYKANISILKLLGIILLFIEISKFRELKRYKVSQTMFLITFFLMASLMVPLIFPWEQDFPFFPWAHDFSLLTYKYNLIIAVKQFFTFCSELGCILFIGRLFFESESVSLKPVLIIILLSVLGIYLEKIFKIDIFHVFTGGTEMLLEGRARGLTYEPRAASYYMAIIIASLTIFPIKLTLKILLILLSSGAFVFANSMTGTVILFTSLTIVLLCGITLRTRFLKSYLRTLIIITLSGVIFFQLPYSIYIKKHLLSRSYILSSQRIVERLESAESAVLNFYISNPKYLFFGLGVGQAPVATSKYLTKEKLKWWGNGLTYLPFMGIFLILANGGLFLLALYIAIIIYGLKEVLKMDIDKDKRDLLFTFACLFLGTYFIQVRYFHILGFAILLYAEMYNKNQNGTKSEKHIEKQSLSSVL